MEHPDTNTGNFSPCGVLFIIWPVDSLFFPFPSFSLGPNLKAGIMFIISILASLLCAVPVPTAHSRPMPMWNTQLPFTIGFPYGSQPVRGVNLGGWLVLEVCRSSPFSSPWFHSTCPKVMDNTVLV